MSLLSAIGLGPRPATPAPTPTPAPPPPPPPTAAPAPPPAAAADTGSGVATGQGGSTGTGTGTGTGTSNAGTPAGGVSYEAQPPAAPAPVYVVDPAPPPAAAAPIDNGAPATPAVPSLTTATAAVREIGVAQFGSVRLHTEPLSVAAPEPVATPAETVVVPEPAPQPLVEARSAYTRTMYLLLARQEVSSGSSQRIVADL